MSIGVSVSISSVFVCQGSPLLLHQAGLCTVQRSNFVWNGSGPMQVLGPEKPSKFCTKE